MKRLFFTITRSSSRNSTHINSYSLALVIEAATGSTVNHKFQSGKMYVLYHESSFLVLPDGKTVVAPLYQNYKNYQQTWRTLFAEDITTGKGIQINTHLSDITTVLYDEASKSLFAGDKSGHIIQYQKDAISFSQSKSYGNLGFGVLHSSAVVKGFAIFGGTKKCIVAIDIQSKEIFSGSVKTAFTNIHTLTPCEVSGSRSLLSVGGHTLNYSDTCTDIFEMHFEETRNEESSLTTTSPLTTQTHPELPEPTSYPGVHCQNLVNTIISSLQGYVKGLFSDFTRVYWDKLRELQGKYY